MVRMFNLLWEGRVKHLSYLLPPQSSFCKSVLFSTKNKLFVSHNYLLLLHCLLSTNLLHLRALDIMTSQFFPACFSVAINGLANNSVQFQDLNTNRIMFCVAKTWVNNSTGENQNVYEIWYQEYNQLSYTTYLFPRTYGEGVGKFLQIVQAWSPTNNLTQYYNWQQLNRRPVGSGLHDVGGTGTVARDILLNDDYVSKRIYVVNEIATNLFVAIGQTLDYQIFQVAGDQTKNVNYYYNYSWSG